MLSRAAAPRFRTHALLILSLVVILYVIPCLWQMLLAGRTALLVATITIQAVICLFFAFVTNARFAAISLFIAANTLQLFLLVELQQPFLAIWIGNAVSAMLAIHFADRLYLNMGK